MPIEDVAGTVKDFIAAASLVLTADDLAQIARILPDGGFGARFPAGRFPSGSDQKSAGRPQLSGLCRAHRGA